MYYIAQDKDNLYRSIDAEFIDDITPLKQLSRTTNRYS